MACFPEVRLLAVGDFNNYLDHKKGKLPGVTISKRSNCICPPAGGAQLDGCVEDAIPQCVTIFVLLCLGCLGSIWVLEIGNCFRSWVCLGTKPEISDHSPFWVELSVPARTGQSL